MPQDKSLELLDLIIIVIKKRIFIILIFFSVLIVSYLSIYFLVEEQYESSALIIPSEQEGTAFSSLMKGLSDFPLAGIAGVGKAATTELYNTLVYSRSNLEKVVKEFDLAKEYESENSEEAVEELRSKIFTDDESENAFYITVRASSPQKSADITNYLVHLLNKTVIDLNIKKSRSNREFLEARYVNIKDNLKKAEDSLRKYQEKTGIYEAEEQVKMTIKAYADYESQLALKQVEMSIIEKLYGKESPQFVTSKITVDEYLSKYENIREGKGDGSNTLLPISSLPVKSMDYLRIFRDVEVNNALLKFIIPLYEQARFEEQKEIPILQVVDYAVPPLKRAYPKRVVTALIISIIISFLVILILIITELIRQSDNPKIQFIRQNINFKTRE